MVTFATGTALLATRTAPAETGTAASTSGIASPATGLASPITGNRNSSNNSLAATGKAARLQEQLQRLWK
jgi:hypothetical protein